MICKCIFISLHEKIMSVPYTFSDNSIWNLLLISLEHHQMLAYLFSFDIHTFCPLFHFVYKTPKKYTNKPSKMFVFCFSFLNFIHLNNMLTAGNKHYTHLCCVVSLFSVNIYSTSAKTLKKKIKVVVVNFSVRMSHFAGDMCLKWI